MDNIKSLEDKLDKLQNSSDTLILIELCKLGATRDQVREVLGSLNNNTFAKINKIVSENNLRRRNAKEAQ